MHIPECSNSSLTSASLVKSMEVALVHAIFPRDSTELRSAKASSARFSSLDCLQGAAARNRAVIFTIEKKYRVETRKERLRLEKMIVPIPE